MKRKNNNIPLKLITASVFILGLVATTVVYQSKKKTEIAKAHQEFKLQASLRSKDIQSEFMRSFFQISSIANLFSSSSWVSNEEFNDFIERVFPVFPSGRKLSFINHLLVNEYDEFIQNVANNPEPQFKNFEVFDFIQGEKVFPATTVNNAYNFVQYTYPASKNNTVYGRNIRPNSPIGPRLFKVMSNMEPLISHVSLPVVGFTEKPFFIHMQPIIKKDIEGKKVATGAILSSQYIENVFLNETIQQTLDIFEYQIIDQIGNHYYYPQKKFIAKAEVPDKQEEKFYYENTIDIVGGKWQLKIFPKESLKKSSSNLLINLFVVGIILSFFVALITHLLINQRRKLTQQVEKKTAQLNAAMQNLNENNKKLASAVQVAEKSAKVKSEFLANMSHEIRTPLNGVYGFLQLLFKTKLDENQIEYLTDMDSSVKHLMSVINDILDFSKIEAGKITIESVPFSIHKCLDLVKKSVGQQAKDKGLAFNLNIITHLQPDLLGDMIRVNQVLLNLCSNAIKFTEEGTVDVNVSMALTEPDDIQSSINVSFEVVDSGIGLKPEQISGLFNAFTQADTSTTRRFGGTGLGLSISQKICQLMGGEITVKSTFGEGSSFTASMTLAQNTSIIEKDKADNTFSRSIPVLFVDDNPIAIKSLSLNLKAMNAEIWASESCFKALEHLKEHSNKYEVIITDWTMKEMTGGDFITKVSALNLPLTPKFIVLSAYDLSVIEQAKPNLNIEAILQKPCLYSQLFNTIEKAVSHEHQKIIHEVNDRSLAGLKVLVAEDNRINQVVIKAMLKNEQVDLVICENGQKCLEKLTEEGPYDLILMDINMPVLDGMQATKAIRALADPQLANTPIIALTANVLEQDIKGYLAIGMNAHTAKPVEFTSLKSTILKVLAENSRS